MRKLKGILVLAAFALSFAVGAMVAPAKADLPCTAACINGHLRVCCYNTQGVYTCTTKGRCLFD